MNKKILYFGMFTLLILVTTMNVEASTGDMELIDNTLHVSVDLPTSSGLANETIKYQKIKVEGDLEEVDEVINVTEYDVMAYAEHILWENTSLDEEYGYLFYAYQGNTTVAPSVSGIIAQSTTYWYIWIPESTVASWYAQLRASEFAFELIITLMFIGICLVAIVAIVKVNNGNIKAQIKVSD